MMKGAFVSPTLYEWRVKNSKQEIIFSLVWVVSPNKTLFRHLFDLVSKGGDSTSTNMRDYFDNFANELRQICECTSTICEAVSTI
jgi:hypothetical protein